METKITVTKWDTYKRTIKFTEEDEITPIDITGSNIKFSLKKEIKDTNYVVQQEATLTDPTNWIATLLITDTVMKTIDIWSYFYDIQWTDLSGVVKTVLKWDFTVTYDIT